MPVDERVMGVLHDVPQSRADDRPEEDEQAEVKQAFAGHAATDAQTDGGQRAGDETEHEHGAIGIHPHVPDPAQEKQNAPDHHQHRHRGEEMVASIIRADSATFLDSRFLGGSSLRRCSQNNQAPRPIAVSASNAMTNNSEGPGKLTSTGLK